MSRVRWQDFAVPFFLLTPWLISNHLSESSLISQSQVETCNHGDPTEPKNEDGEPCDTKMLVVMALHSGQASHQSPYNITLRAYLAFNVF